MTNRQQLTAWRDALRAAADALTAALAVEGEVSPSTASFRPGKPAGPTCPDCGSESRPAPGVKPFCFKCRKEY